MKTPVRSIAADPVLTEPENVGPGGPKDPERLTGCGVNVAEPANCGAGDPNDPLTPIAGTGLTTSTDPEKVGRGTERLPETLIGPVPVFIYPRGCV